MIIAGVALSMPIARVKCWRYIPLTILRHCLWFIFWLYDYRRRHGILDPWDDPLMVSDYPKFSCLW